MFVILNKLRPLIIFYISFSKIHFLYIFYYNYLNISFQMICLIELYISLYNLFKYIMQLIYGLVNLENLI